YQDFHQVDFVEASHIRYSLTFNPTVHVSHIRQLWSTARIETTEEGTKIFATIDGKLRTVSESSIRRNLKLNDEKFTFQKGQFSHQWKYLIHTIMQCLSPKSTGFNEFSSNIATALVCLATNRVYNFSKMIFDGMVKNVNNNVSKFLMQYTRRARIAQSLALPTAADKRVSLLGDGSQGEACPTGSMQHQIQELTALCTSLQRQHTEMASKIEAQELEITNLKARVKLLEDREGGEMVTVLTSLDVATVLSSGVAEVPTGSGSIPTVGPTATGIPTGSGMIDVQLARELEEEMARDTHRMNEQIAQDAEIARIHAEEELQMMNDGLDRNNETVVKYLQEYYQFAVKLPIGRRIELISDLVKYQDNYAKVLKFQTQQRKPLSRKQQKDFYMSVLRSHAGWKARHFKGMTLKEVKEKFDPVWEQMQYFFPIGSKEESERFKRKGLRLEHDREDLNQLWALVKETLNIRPATNDKEMELWVELKRSYEPDVEDLLWTYTQNLMHAPVEWKLYDTCVVHHVISKDQEIFMLVEKDYPMRKGLAIGMISYKLQVENYSQMANDLILKIYKIANSLRQQDD
nr:synaptobrevin, longin-like domain protein [Tanacetum cinerariifolium]